MQAARIDPVESREPESMKSELEPGAPAPPPIEMGKYF